jgi:4'-phosphopantetheinyl transferase
MGPSVLRPSTIHWLTQTSRDPPVGEEWLTAGEQATLARLHVAKRRRDWLLGRWTAKRALVAYLGCDGLGRLEVRAADSGAPEVFLDGRAAPLTLSLSHAAGCGLCAVTTRGVALGCDLERIEARDRAFVTDYFTDDEQRSIATAPAADRACIVTLLWSAKESALKALREGLRFDTRSVAATLVGDSAFDSWCPLSVCHGDSGRIFRGWWRRDGGCVMTIVADPAPPPPISLHRRDSLPSPTGF